MPRLRSVKIISIAAAVLACGFISLFAWIRCKPEPSFQGRSASQWLSEVGRGNRSQALAAFRQMGTQADSVLECALEARDSGFATAYRRIYDSKLTETIRKRLPEPPESPWTLQAEAIIVLQNASNDSIVAKLLPLLRQPDSRVRLTLLPEVYILLGSRNAGQIPFLLLAANDVNPSVREEALLCLGRLGQSASSAMPTILNLCADQDLDVRMHAALTLWKITGQTNTAVPALEGILRQSKDAGCPRRVAAYLIDMGISSRLLTTILDNSRTNRFGVESALILGAMSRSGPPPEAHIPALLEGLQDPDSEERLLARFALTGINPEHAGTNSP